MVIINAIAIIPQYGFPIDPFFKVYQEVSEFYNYPTPEELMNHYDTTVQYKLKDLEFIVNPSIASINRDSPWSDLRKLDEETIQAVEDLIGMKCLLGKEDIVGVLEFFRCMYMTDYEVFRNLPIKEVW